MPHGIVCIYCSKTGFPACADRNIRNTTYPVSYPTDTGLKKNNLSSPERHHATHLRHAWKYVPNPNAIINLATSRARAYSQARCGRMAIGRLLLFFLCPAESTCIAECLRSGRAFPPFRRIKRTCGCQLVVYQGYSLR